MESHAHNPSEGSAEWTLCLGRLVSGMAQVCGNAAVADRACQGLCCQLDANYYDRLCRRGGPEL